MQKVFSSKKVLLLVLVGVLGLTVAGVTSASAGKRVALNSRPGHAAKVQPAACGKIWAVVNADGSLARGKCAVSVLHPVDVASSYQVNFGKDVSKCAYEATLGLSGDVGVPPPGFVTTATRNGVHTAVYVATWNGSGVGTPEPFHIVVTC